MDAPSLNSTPAILRSARILVSIARNNGLAVPAVRFCEYPGNSETGIAPVSQRPPASKYIQCVTQSANPSKICVAYTMAAPRLSHSSCKNVNKS